MQLIVNRYARALFKLASQHEITHLILHDINMINNLFVDQPAVWVFLTNRSTSLSDADQACDIIAGQLKLNKFMDHFLKLLVKDRRINLFKKITKNFQDLIDHQQGIIRAKITSAVILDDPSKRRLEHVLSDKLSQKVIGDYHLDPGLMTGHVIKINSLLWDYSLKSKLLQLQRHLLIS